MYYAHVMCFVFYTFLLNGVYSAALERGSEREEAVVYWRCPENPKLNLDLHRAEALRDKLQADEGDPMPSLFGSEDLNAYELGHNALADVLTYIDNLRALIKQYREDSVKKPD